MGRGDGKGENRGSQVLLGPGLTLGKSTGIEERKRGIRPKRSSSRSPTPSLLPTSWSETSEPAQVPSGCSTESGPAPAAHLEVAGRGVEAATLGPGDALEPAEDEALVALAAFHAAVLAGHAQECGMAGVRAQLGTQGVSAVGWAGQRWWRGGGHR